jgi:flotillin
VADLEAEGVAGEAKAARERDVAVADQSARTEQGRKEAERNQRVAVAGYEAEAVKGENESKASIADYEATLDERQADAKRRGEIALANASRDVLLAEKEQELARMQKMEVAPREIAKRKMEIDAEAEAERARRIAKGDADAILARYMAEAEGTQKVLEAKADGYKRLIASCGGNTDLAPTLLLLEKMPELIETQVKAIQNLKIDKITVWDSGQGGEGDGTTAGFLRGLIGSLPPMHELAKQAGINLPGYLGNIDDLTGQPTAPGTRTRAEVQARDARAGPSGARFGTRMIESTRHNKQGPSQPARAFCMETLPGEVT